MECQRWDAENLEHSGEMTRQTNVGKALSQKRATGINIWLSSTAGFRWMGYRDEFFIL